MLTYNEVRGYCVSCGRSIASFGHRYRGFFAQPVSVVTLASLVLLLAAGIRNPGGLFGSGEADDAGTLLYLAAALVGSSYIWWSALQGIRARDFTADIPVSVATAAAIAIGQYSAAAVVAVLLLIGSMLENFVAARAGKAMEALAALLPSTVLVRRDEGESVIALGDVIPGDLLIVRSGERIAVDGLIEHGHASVDQAAITGESMLVEKTVGATVFAGTFCAVGALEIRAEKVGGETTIGHVRRMIGEAQTQKAPIERLLDTYAKFYTPIALLLGGVLWWITGDILRAITMLIVFCPCVMVLATPTALVASIGNAALRGGLIKKGATIEALSKVTAVAFDKTGTVTHGAPRLVAAIAFNATSEDDLLRFAAAAEKLSEHPLGRAVVTAAEERGLDPAKPGDFNVLPGIGVIATVDGRRVAVGGRRMLADLGIAMPRAVNSRADELERAGRAALIVAVADEIIGMLVVEDTLRSQAKPTMSALDRLRIRTVLVSGDTRTIVERIASDLGVGEIHAEALPSDKVAIVRRLQDQRLSVAFVGDGVNDGPALATADVGVAMGMAGTDVAIETADIALLSDDLEKLPHLLELSRRAIRVITQNVYFSIGVLAVAVGLTAFGVLTPVTGALLHELSSIPVIMNSARLIGYRGRLQPVGEAAGPFEVRAA